jgi:hypothetical protein
MARERSFRGPNKRVHLQELTDLIALRLSALSNLPGAHSREPEQWERFTRRELETLAPNVPLSQIRALEDAGWRFARRRDLTGTTRPGQTAPVFLRSGGRLALGTVNLTVRLRPQFIENPSVWELLADQGCEVIERLSFAPGLLRLRLTDQTQTDVVEVANELVESGLCEFAEPELIEVMGSR